MYSYLDEFTGNDKLFPSLFSTFLYPLFCDCVKLENCSSDQRILLVVRQYSRIMRGTLSLYLSYIEMLGVSNVWREERYSYLADVLETVIGQSANRKQSTTEVVYQTPEPRDPMEYKRRLQKLQEGIMELHRKIQSTDEISRSDDQTTKTPTYDEHVKTPCEEEDTPLTPSEGGQECMVILLSLLTSAMRSAHFAQSKMIVMSMLTDFTKFLPDAVILQRVLPHFVNILQEVTESQSQYRHEEYASVLSLVAYVSFL